MLESFRKGLLNKSVVFASFVKKFLSSAAVFFLTFSAAQCEPGELINDYD